MLKLSWKATNMSQSDKIDSLLEVKVDIRSNLAATSNPPKSNEKIPR
uniref:Uncharacterized protein LOC105637462 n=1 Tax=Rhizophora mucronata TaxID=61149 RepID=A0A2P2KHM5_RHIMU